MGCGAAVSAFSAAAAQGSCLLLAGMAELRAMISTGPVDVFDRVLGDLHTLLPSQVDAVAIVNTPVDAGQAEEHLEIVEVAGRYGEARRAASCLASQRDRWNVFPVEVLEHGHYSGSLNRVISSVFRMCRRWNQREPTR